MTGAPGDPVEAAAAGHGDLPSRIAAGFLVLLSALALALGLGAAIAIGLGMKDTVADVAKKHKDKINRLF